MATTTWKDFEKIAGTRVEEDGGKWVRKAADETNGFDLDDIFHVVRDARAQEWP